MRGAQFTCPDCWVGISRSRLRRKVTGVAFGLAVGLLPLTAAAQDFRLHVVAGVGHAVGGYQQRELSFGGTARAAFELLLFRELGVYGQASGTWLGAGELPKNHTLAPLDAATSYAGIGGLHLRPFASRASQSALSISGLWLGGGGGMAYTGGVSRPIVDAGLGLDLLFAQGRYGIGPMVGLEHVFQPNTELRPQDANVLFFGVHGMLEIGAIPPKVDGDRDQDGILDSVDKCPDDPEDKDGFEDQDGCPDKDNDQDGIADVIDACPNVAEDKDGFEDDDGCPDPDNDKDGIPDAKDLCPNEPETFNGYADEDGCPDAEQIRVVGDKIVLDDRVHFMVNMHVIRSESYPLLERLARLINQNPTYVHIEVQGHTDERGPDSYNDKLSQDRANAVMEFLVSRGVKRDRLSAHGFGKTKPLVEKNSEYAWYMNRRVEFEITRENSQSTFTTLNGQPPPADAKPNTSKPDAAAPPTEPTPDTTKPDPGPPPPILDSTKAADPDKSTTEDRR